MQRLEKAKPPAAGASSGQIAERVTPALAPPAACRHRGQGTGGAQILRVAQYSRNPMLTELLCAELYPLLRLYRGLPVDARPRTRRAVVEHERVVSAMRIAIPISRKS
jgi:hypothetical protein